MFAIVTEPRPSKAVPGQRLSIERAAVIDFGPYMQNETNYISRREMVKLAGITVAALSWC
jgi:hypothetical protein